MSAAGDRYGRRGPPRGLWLAPDGQPRVPLVLVASPSATGRMRLAMAIAGLAVTVINAAEPAEIEARVRDLRPDIVLVSGYPLVASGLCPALDAIARASADTPVLRLTPATEWERAEHLRRRRGMELVTHPDDLAAALVVALGQAGWQHG